MPEISRITLKRGSVAYCLAQSKRELLPEEIVGDVLTQWVMSFDTLQNDTIHRDARRDQINRDDHYGWEGQLYSYLITSILQMHIPFYFASLFHIGRQWQAAIFSLESINDIEQEDNLFTSAKNLVALNERSEHNTDLSIESTAQLIMMMCQQGRKEQSRQLNLAKEWWKIWRSEVEFYQNALNEFQEYFSSHRWFKDELRYTNEIVRPIMRLIAYIIRGSSLRREMQHHGVQFKPEMVMHPTADQQILWSLLAIAIANAGKDDYFAGHIFEEFLNALRIQQLAPRIEIALEVLRRKYGEVEPFTKYDVGKSAPTLELLELIREHSLPDGSDSPWLDTWKRTLDNVPNNFDKLPKSIGQLGKALPFSIRSADSTIKHNLTQRLYFAESWEDFLQRIFEKKWIQRIGVMICRANQDANSPTPMWDLQTFMRFIADVVAGLNKLGYSLTVPSLSRLASLLDQARKSKGMYEDFTW